MILQSNKLRFCLFLAVISIISAPASAQEKPVLALKTVVIDAGHGGKDPGTVWSGIREKDINLDVAVRFGNLIKKNFPSVNVIYTRTKDVYIPLSERSAIANKNKADLFISIHTNSVKGSSAARGTETYLMGTDKSGRNMEVCKRENSVILLEEDYTTKYAGYDPNTPDSFIFFNLMQTAQFEQSVLMASYVEEQMALGPISYSRGIKQATLLVLWQATMPSVLIEMGFLSNDSDREKLKDGKKRGEIATCLFQAFKRFKEQYEIGGDSNVNVAALMSEDTTAVTVSAALPAATPSEKQKEKKFETKSGKNAGKQVEKKPEKNVGKQVEPKAEKNAGKQVEPKAEKNVGKQVENKPEKNVGKKVEPKAEKKIEKQVIVGRTHWRIQIMAASKELKSDSPALKGIPCNCIKVNGLYKYFTGIYGTHHEAVAELPSIKEKFPGSFVVEFGSDDRPIK